MKRKTFIQKAMSAVLLSLPVYTLIACSSSGDDMGNDPNPDPDPEPMGNCLSNGTNTAIGSNHGHTLTVPSSDIETGAQKTYSIQGSSDHNHDITLTADHFTSLKGNSSISVSSTSDDGHTHSVQVSCA